MFLVTVAKAAGSGRWWEVLEAKFWKPRPERGQGSVQSQGRDGEADDPDFREGKAPCSEAPIRGTAGAPARWGLQAAGAGHVRV